jgi:hypothetical protein
MTYRVAYLVKAYDIPPNLVVNTYQTGERPLQLHLLTLHNFCM